MKRDPVVLDERYVLAYTVYYAIAGLWGILAIRNGFSVVQETAGSAWEILFASLVTVLSLVLSCLTLTNAQKTEKWTTLAWVAIVVGVPASAIYQWLAEGDVTRAAGSASTFLYLIFPFARFVYLSFRTRKVKV